MSGLTTALSLLLAQTALRDAYRQDPEALARRLEVGAPDLPSFLSLDLQGLEAQARSLKSKRFHEISSFLPRTMVLLGVSASQEFFAFAEDFWPKGHKRHLLDAINFCEHLRSLGNHRIAAEEFNRVRFLYKKSRITFHFVKDYPYRDRTCPAVQVLFRLGGTGFRERTFFLGF